MRLDQLLVERGLAETRAEAARLLLAGRIRLAGQTADKPGRLVQADVVLERAEGPRYVSRGGEKLAAALQAFAVVPRDRVCLDVGASTGGFTDCLLKMGARRVYAVDVGRGQLHPSLRADPRVTRLEAVNARSLDPARFDEPPSLATVDVAFISLEKVLPAVAGCLAAPAGAVGAAMPEIVALVKPQFEVGRGQVGKGGVVRDSGRHREVLLRLAAFASAHGLAPRGVAASPLRGPKGNREFFLHLRVGGVGLLPESLDAAVRAVLAADAAGPDRRAAGRPSAREGAR